MAGPSRVPDATREAIVAAVRAGQRRAEVARKYHVSDTTVTNLARAAGLVDEPLTAARKLALQTAVEANRLRAKHRRSRQVLALLADSDRLRRQLWKPARVFAFGRNAAGETAYIEHEVAEMPAQAKRDTAIALGILQSKALELIRLDQEADTVGAVKGAIVELVQRLEEAEEAATHTGGNNGP
ncbi:MAG: hypothetical protein ACHQ0J_01840 [Candidatus Dormibacterales bacterium]